MRGGVGAAMIREGAGAVRVAAMESGLSPGGRQGISAVPRDFRRSTLGHPTPIAVKHPFRTVWLVLLVALLAGCSGGGDRDFDGVTVTFWHSFVATTQPALRELIARFHEEHPHIRIREQYVPTGDGLVQKLISSLHTGTAPDISWVHGDFLGRLAGAGAIYPMRHFIDGPEGLSEEEYADIFPELLRSASWRDTLFAMPMEATLLALFYNRDLFREAGLDPDRPPETWDELRDFTRRLTPAEDRRGRTERYGFYVPVFPASGPLNLWMVRQWAPFLWMAGGSLIEPDQRAVTFDSEAGVQALTLWRDLYTDMRGPSYSFGHDLSFASGYVAMVMNGPWDLPRFRRINDFEWGVAPLPRLPGGEHATYLDGEHLAIFRQSNHADEAWTFVRWMLQPETQAFFSMESGYLPVRRAVLDLPSYRAHLEEDDGMRAFVEQMPLGRAREAIDWHSVEINRYVAEAIERSLVGGVDPGVALAESAARSNRLLRGDNGP